MPKAVDVAGPAAVASTARLSETGSAWRNWPATLLSGPSVDPAAVVSPAALRSVTSTERDFGASGCRTCAGWATEDRLAQCGGVDAARSARDAAMSN